MADKRQSADMYLLESIVVRYGGVTALDIDRLLFKRGGLCAVVGANGSGKSTLLSLLAFLKPPTGGRLWFDGAEATAPGFDIAAARRRATLVTQEPYLFQGTVGENVGYGLRQRGVSGGTLRERVDRALKAVDLTAKMGDVASSLSGGEARRVAIARALALETEVLLLDECTANVDRAAQSVIEALLLRMRGERTTTIILATHDPSFALKTADETLALAGGRPAASHVENLYRGVVEDEDGISLFRMAGGKLTMEVISDKRGACVAAVPPDDVLISRSPISSSARNSYRGAIRRLEEIDAQIKVFVDIGIEIAALITRKSYQEMGLHLGDEVCVTFKVSVVKVL